MPSRSPALLCCALTSMYATAAAAAPQAVVIDRVVAVVNGAVITLSDVHGALRFGLISTDGSTDLRTAIERVIDRRLALVEVERYAPPEPPEERIDAAVAEARAKFGSEPAFAAALAETGLTLDQLRRHYRNHLRQQAYEQQRFGFALNPSESDMLAYYRSNQDRFKREGVLPPFDDVRADVQAALVAGKRAELIRDWMAGLRRRAEIVLPPR